MSITGMGSFFQGLGGIVGGESGQMLNMLGGMFSQAPDGEEAQPQPAAQSPPLVAPIKKLPEHVQKLSLKSPQEKAATTGEIGAPADINQPEMANLASILSGSTQGPDQSMYDNLATVAGGIGDLVTNLGGLFGGGQPSPLITAQNPLGLTPGQGL